MKRIVRRFCCFLLAPLTVLAFPVLAFSADYLSISGTSIYVELAYFGSNSLQGSQQAVNNEGMAACIDLSADYGFRVCPVIADHCTQGFDQMIQSVVGETTATISYSDGTSTTYICADIDHNAVNDTVYLWSHGRDALLKVPSDWLCMYTCNQKGQPENVTVSFWQPVE